MFAEDRIAVYAGPDAFGVPKIEPRPFRSGSFRISGVIRMDDPLDRMLTLSEAARAIGQYRQLIYRWRERGLLVTDDQGRVSYRSVLDAEWRTRNNDQPGAWHREPKLLAAV